MKYLYIGLLTGCAVFGSQTVSASDTDGELKGALKKVTHAEAVAPKTKKGVRFTEKKDVVYFGNDFKKDPPESYYHDDKTPFFYTGKTHFEYSKSYNEEKREFIEGADLDAPLKWMEKFNEGRLKTKKEEFLDKAENERKYREAKEASATKAGGQITYAYELAQQVQDNLMSMTTKVPQFPDGSARWKTLIKPYRDAARALLLCIDDEQTTSDVARSLHGKYIEITKMMAELYFKLAQESEIFYHNNHNSLVLTTIALIQAEEFDFSYNLLCKMKASLPARRAEIHQNKERLAIEKLPEDPSTCLCEDSERSIDELLHILDCVKVAKAKGLDYLHYIEAQLPKQPTEDQPN